MFIFQPKANFLEIMKKVNLSFVVELLYNAIKFIAHTCFSIFNVLLKLIVTDELETSLDLFIIKVRIYISNVF